MILLCVQQLQQQERKKAHIDTPNADSVLESKVPENESEHLSNSAREEANVFSRITETEDETESSNILEKISDIFRVK